MPAKLTLFTPDGLEFSLRVGHHPLTLSGPADDTERTTTPGQGLGRILIRPLDENSFVAESVGAAHAASVNSEPLGDQPLRDGDLIRLGAVEVQFTSVPRGPEDGPPLVSAEEHAELERELSAMRGKLTELFSSVAELDDARDRIDELEAELAAARGGGVVAAESPEEMQRTREMAAASLERDPDMVRTREIDAVQVVAEEDAVRTREIAGSEMARLEEERDRAEALVTEIEQLRGQLKAARAEAQEEAGAELRRLKIALSSSESEREALRDRLARAEQPRPVEKPAAGPSDEAAALQGQLKTAQASLAEARARIEAMAERDSRSLAIKKEGERLQEQLRQRDQREAQLAAQLAATNARVGELTKMVEKLQFELASKEVELAEARSK